MHAWENVWRIGWLCTFVLSANGLCMAWHRPWMWAIWIPALIATNLFIGFTERTIRRLRLKVCYHGVECLSLFCASSLVSVAYHATALAVFPGYSRELLFSAIFSCVAHAILFGNGILCVYLTSGQLGIKWRVLGVVCGLFIPINFICFSMMLSIVQREISFETDKDILNESRKDEEVCRTKYPILLVHGIYFRDSYAFDYWGRIPAELKKNGATVHYGRHSSASSIADSGNELAWRIKALASRYGCEKFNIIAHSKGGLDCRYALMFEDIAPYVASLTTVNTPHRGSYFADFMLGKAPAWLERRVEIGYNKAARLLGDDDPDFMVASRDMATEARIPADKEWTVPEGIYCQSIGSVMKYPQGGQFPMNVCNAMVKSENGRNDGLVSEDSFSFGERYILLKPQGRHGISHLDIIDLTRRDIPGFDVREFYVDLVRDLKARGL